jgi:hypothetical protein
LALKPVLYLVWKYFVWVIVTACLKR